MLESLAAVQAQHTLKEQPIVLAGDQALNGAKVEILVNTLTGGLSRFAKECPKQVLQNKDEQVLYCVDAMVSGLKVTTLVDSGATHSFVSERTAWGCHRKAECDGSSFKVVNLGVKLVAGIIRLALLIVGSLGHDSGAHGRSESDLGAGLSETCMSHSSPT